MSEGIVDLLHNRWVLPISFVFLLILAIYLRTGLLRYQGFYEPDDFFYYALVKATLSNNFVMPQILSLSGFPLQQPHMEAPGLAYLPVILYIPLQYLGISVLTIMRLLPVGVALLEMIGVYFIIKLLLKSRLAGLLGMFFVAVSIGNIARTGALVYRGDTYISLVLIYSILFAFIALGESNRKRTFIFALLSAFVLSLGIVMWNGASLAIAVYLISLILIFCFGFVNDNLVLLEKNCMFAGGLLFSYILDRIFIAVGIAVNGYPLYGNNVLPFYVLFVIVNMASVYVLRMQDRHSFLSTANNRMFAILISLVIAIFVVFTIFGALIGSFSVAYFAYPHINLNDSLAGKVSSALIATTLELQKPSLGFLFGSFNIQLFLAPIGLIIILFFSKNMNLDRRFNISSELLFLISYFAVAAYLQSEVTRFSSVLSIPIAIFAACGLYLLGHAIHQKVGWRHSYFYIFIAVSAVMLAYDLYYAFLFNSVNVQADSINPNFLSAMSWMSNNTPSNATIITEWADGSVVEGWAGRASLMDSVGGQHRYLVYNFTYNFTRFLFNQTSNTRYLLDSKPQYIAVRTVWLNEMGYLAPEGLLNSSQYGYIPLSNATLSNAGALTFSMPAYSVLVALKQSGNGINATGAYFDSGGTEVPISQVLLYNNAQNTYTIVPSSIKTDFNYTLLIQYSGTQITNAYLVSRALFDSNMFKLIYLCDPNSCIYGKKTNTTFTPVFANNDTRIFKIGYNT